MQTDPCRQLWVACKCIFHKKAEDIEKGLHVAAMTTVTGPCHVHITSTYILSATLHKTLANKDIGNAISSDIVLFTGRQTGKMDPIVVSIGLVYVWSILVLALGQQWDYTVNSGILHEQRIWILYIDSQHMDDK